MKIFSIYIKIIFFVLITTITSLIFLDRIVGNKLNDIYQGWNYKGYRGLIKKEKKVDHLRIAVFGGSVSAGYGLNYRDAIPYLLEKKLLKKKIDVVNLGRNGLGIYGILHDIEYYKYLKYDIAIIHNGYNDCTIKGYNLNTRNNNLIYKYFKYLTILDVYLPEKIHLLLNKEDKNALDNYYKKKEEQIKIKYKNNPNKNLSSYTCKAIFENKKTKLIVNKKKFINHLETFSLKKYNEVLKYLVKTKKQIFVIIQPKYGDDPLQKIQSKLIIEMSKKFKEVKIIDLSEKIDLNDPKISYDRLHNTKAGNELTVKILLQNLNNS